MSNQHTHISSSRDELRRQLRADKPGGSSDQNGMPIKRPHFAPAPSVHPRLQLGTCHSRLGRLRGSDDARTELGRRRHVHRAARVGAGRASGCCSGGRSGSASRVAPVDILVRPTQRSLSLPHHAHRDVGAPRYTLFRDLLRLRPRTGILYDDLSARGTELSDKPAQQPWGWWAAIKRSRRQHHRPAPVTGTTAHGYAATAQQPTCQ
jgi:hypothetical protein